jgi:TPR repeat protein
LSGYYARGWYGFPEDLKKTEELLVKAAQQGHLGAQSSLGRLYDKVKNYADALKWVRVAAKAGDRGSQRLLFEYYRYPETHGNVVSENSFEALQWLKRAAEGGDDEAQNELGAAYAAGSITIQNYAEAAKWYLAAAEQGNGWAQHNVGSFYRNGTGVKKDLIEAHKWLNIASFNGGYWRSPAAKDERDALEEVMNKTQIDKAQALATKWKPDTSGIVKNMFFGAETRQLFSLAPND